MFVKLQHFDTNCFHVLGSIKASPTIGVSVSSPLENLDSIKKQEKKKKLMIIENQIEGGVNSFTKVYRKTSHESKNDVFHGSHDDFMKTPDGEISLSYCRSKNKNGGRVVKVRENGKNGFVGKARAKCSTKWGSYGGCIPSILSALERIKDLDEAFRPWEDDLNHKERSIILKEQRSWERAMEIFEWFKKGCYELNVIHYNIMFRTLGKAKQWILVEVMWDEMKKRGVSPVNSTYGTLIDVYSKGGCKKDSVNWIKLMRKQGIEPDEVTMGIIVQMYKKAGEFKTAEQFFINWSSAKTCGVNINAQSRVSFNLYTYNTLIDTYGKAGNLLGASGIFKRMLRDGIIPNTITFNTMIHICGNNGQLEEVTSLMQKMEELGCPFDTRTFNILISIHAQNDNIDIAASYFAKMKEACLEPDIVSYRTLLYAFSIRRMVDKAEELISEMDEKSMEIDEYTHSSLTRMYIEATMIERSWLWFERFYLGGKMSSECLSANIDAYGERGYVMEAEKVFNCCLERGNLTVLEFNVMIKSYGIGKIYDKACELFDSMKHYAVTPDKCSYNALIQILSGANLPIKAKPYLRKMQEAGFVIECSPYCAVISSFTKIGLLDMAEELYEEMIAHNVQPDIILYGVFINAFADMGCVKAATFYVDEIITYGLAMNGVIYNSLIKLYTKVRYLNEAQEIYVLLQLSDEGTDVYSSNCMIDLYTERLMVEEAEAIFGNLRREAKANEFSFAMMLCMYKKIRRLEDATKIAKEMRESEIITDLLSYNNIIGLYAMDGRFKEAIKTFREMLNSSINPDDYTFKSLGAVMMTCGVSKQAVSKLEVVRKKDPRGGLKAWISTLSSMFDDEGNDADDFKA